MTQLSTPEQIDIQDILRHWSNTPTRWQGAALGTDVALSVDAPHLEAEVAIQHAEVTLEAICAQFNLFDDNSQIQELNRSGALPSPTDIFLDLCAIITRLHVATNGLFDPTIQPLWRALYDGTAPDRARRLIGWKNVEISTNSITLLPGQKLSFNGVAQGFATDMLTAALRELGIRSATVKLGELAVIGGPAQLHLTQPLPDGTEVIELHNNTLSLSIPQKIDLGAYGHILHPHGLPDQGGWPWVAVEASSAAIADGASTAFTLMTIAEIERALAALPEITRVRIIGRSGTYFDLQP